MEIALQIITALSLSACCGLRTFLPLLAVGVMGRLGYLPLQDHFHWLSGNPALTVFGLATVIEILGDKIPAFDHFLDSVATFVKPIAGTLAAVAVLHRMDPVAAAVLGLILGGSLSSVVHLAKAGARIVSSATTLGFGNPILSIFEDLVTASAALLAILAPVFALLIIAGAALWLFRSRKKTCADT